jgi:hypothetical protein
MFRRVTDRWLWPRDRTVELRHAGLLPRLRTGRARLSWPSGIAARATAAADTSNASHAEDGASCQHSASATTMPSASAGGRQYGEMSIMAGGRPGSNRTFCVRSACTNCGRPNGCSASPSRRARAANSGTKQVPRSSPVRHPRPTVWPTTPAHSTYRHGNGPAPQTVTFHVGERIGPPFMQGTAIRLEHYIVRSPRGALPTGQPSGRPVDTECVQDGRRRVVTRHAVHSRRRCPFHRRDFNEEDIRSCR